MTTTSDAGALVSRRLTELEDRFAALGDALDDSPVTEAISVLHAIVQEVARSAPTAPSGAPPTAPAAHPVADLYRTAPPMSGAAESVGLPVGTVAPDFTLPDAQGHPVSLSDFRGRPVVLVFYPLDWSPGCSRQLELYQQEIDEFTRRGIQLIAVSVDSLYSHGAWAAVRGLTFPLLSDFHPRGEVARRYQVWRESDGFSDRALFVLDTDGVIRWAHVSPRVEQLPDVYDLLAELDRVAVQPAAA